MYWSRQVTGSIELLLVSSGLKPWYPMISYMISNDSSVAYMISWLWLSVLWYHSFVWLVALVWYVLLWYCAHFISFGCHFCHVIYDTQHDTCHIIHYLKSCVTLWYHKNWHDIIIYSWYHVQCFVTWYLTQEYRYHFMKSYHDMQNVISCLLAYEIMQLIS